MPATAPLSIVRALVLALLCASAIGCGLGSESSERTATGQTSDTCQKDRDALSRLLVQPQACTVSSSCPTGSHCDPVAASCTWQCFADSDCGTGNTCTCDGQCLVGGSQPPDGGAPSADPACPRNPALLASIKRTACSATSQCPNGSTCDTSVGRCTNQRACGLDEDCPHGSRCEAATGLCELSCASSSECTGGKVCDCAGQCVEPASTPPPVADPSRVMLRINPPMVAVTGGDWGVQTVNLVLETFDAAIGTGAHAAPTVRVRAPAGITIAGASNTPVKELVLSSWAFAPSADRYAATTAITVARGSDFDASQENWRIELIGDDMVDLRSTLMVGTQPPGSVTRGVFSGALVEVVGAGPGVTRIPVTVWADDDYALIFDPSRAFAPKGRIGIARTASAETVFNWIDNTGITGAQGTLGAKLRFVAPTGSGILDLTRSRLEVWLPLAKRRNLQFRFDLAYASPLPTTTCNLDSQCGTGSYCEEDLAVCVPGEDWRSSSAPNNNLQSPGSNTWLSAASSWMLGNNNDTPGVFGKNNLPGPRGVGYSLMCFPTGPRTYQPSGQFTPGFAHGAAQTIAQASGHLSGSAGLCGQASPLSLVRDRKSADGAVVAAAPDLLRSCLIELAAAPPPAADTPALNAKNWFEAQSACVSLSRAYPLLDWLTPATGPARNRGGVEARLLHETASQWLGVLGFMLGEAVHQSPLPQVLGDDVPAPAGGVYQPPPAVATVLTAAERGFDALLRSKVADGVNSLPRDVLRKPDYRDLRPVSYYTFDADDMRGPYVLDLAGEANLKLPSTTFTQNPASISYPSDVEVAIPRGPAELYGDVLIALKVTVPTVTTTKVLVEYGDDNLLYQFFYKLSGTGVELWAYHGLRTASSGSTAAGAVKVVSNILIPGTTYAMVLRRRAAYTMASDQTVTWASEYKAYVNGQAQLSGTTSNPIPGNMTAAAAGKLRVNALTEDATFWDEAFDDTVPVGDLYATGLGDNPMFGALRRKVASGALDNPDHHRDALAVAVLDTGAQYLRAAQVAMRSEVIAAHASCTPGAAPDADRGRALDHYGRIMRYAWTLESLASSLQARASQRGCVVVANDPQSSCPSGSTCEASPTTGESVCVASGAPLTIATPWQNRYDSALSAFDTARDELVGTVQPVVSCSDLMGVDSLPLFFGDVVGSSSRFFAASDYLVSAWVVPAVDRAAASLEAARQAWLARRSSEIQQIESEQGKARRLEQIEVSAAIPVMELCGITDVSALDVMDKFQSGELSPTTCFRVAKPGCTGTTADTNASCYRGELGKAALAVVSAVSDIRVARMEHDAASGRHKATDQYCATEQEFAKEDLAALDKHNRRMKTLSRWSAVLGGIESVAQTVASMIAPIPGGGGGSDSGGSGSAGWSNTFGSAATMAGIANGILRTGMNEIQNSFERDQFVRSQNAKIRQCQFEADQQKFGLGVLSAQIDRRLIDLQLAMLQMQTLGKRVIRELSEGKAALDREQDRRVPSLVHHYWLDDKIDRFALDLEWSRRLVYLAMRAVEYEFQQSFGLDDAVVRARGPADLDKVVLALQRERAARTINGRRPEETSVVLSLRDDVLHISDRTTPQNDAAGKPRLVGERNWSATRRFGEELRSPKFAVYDDRGEYLGQGVPFSMKEQGALAYRCAERLWRVNATVQGDVIDSRTPSVPVILFKRNTFTSQWCGGKGDGSGYQLGNLRPSAELFRNSGSGGEGDDQGYSSALMYPWFNVVRSEFFRDQYTEGSSEELAGRGLYGDYILLFPESGLLEWTDGDASNDFALHRVEDVLIRLDLLSVDDISLH